jgi:hypothetical protein
VSPRRVSTRAPVGSPGRVLSALDDMRSQRRCNSREPAGAWVSSHRCAAFSAARADRAQPWPGALDRALVPVSPAEAFWLPCLLLALRVSKHHSDSKTEAGGARAAHRTAHPAISRAHRPALRRWMPPGVTHEPPHCSGTAPQPGTGLTHVRPGGRPEPVTAPGRHRHRRRSQHRVAASSCGTAQRRRRTARHSATLTTRLGFPM